MQMRSYGTFKQPQAKRSHLLKFLSQPTSKSVALVLLWTAVVGFINSEINASPFLFVFKFYHDEEAILHAVVGLYIVLAIAMTCYPIGGLLADVFFGRYKTIRNSLIILTFSMLSALTGFVVIIQLDVSYRSEYWKKILLALGGGITFILLALGLAGFTSNIVQFGLDQLFDAPSNKLGAFVHLYVWANRIGFTAFDFIYVIKHCYNETDQYTSLTNGLIYGLSAGGFLILLTLLLVNCFTHRMFNKDSVKYNPYTMIVRVLNFVRKHKRPVGHPSAFAYCDSFEPSRMDYAKERYGGPFTTPDVEDVKTFIRVSLMLLFLGPIFVIIAPTSYYLFANFALHTETHSEFLRGTCSAKWIFLESGLMSDITSSICLPLYTWFLFALLSRKERVPRILYRVQFAAILLVLTTVNMFAVDLTGHLLIANEKHYNETCMFLQQYYLNNFQDHTRLNLHWSVLIFPNLTKALALDLIMASTFEFISAQSPHTMKGVLVGLLFTVRGFFQLIGAVLLFPFSIRQIWENFHIIPQISCGTSYYIVTIVISVLGIVLFVIGARKYQYRKREEEPYSQSMVEEIFDRMLQEREERRVARVNAMHRTSS